jgi:hypothetical protein
MGFNVTNDVFAKNAWYFRNSLVKADTGLLCKIPLITGSVNKEQGEIAYGKFFEKKERYWHEHPDFRQSLVL